MNWLFFICFLALGVVFVSTLFVLSRFLSRRNPNPIKLSIYENGEESLGVPFISVNPRFLYLAFMFVLFEVEIMLLFPWALAYFEINNQFVLWKLFALAEFTVFLFLLSIGLFYAWKLGAFDWGAKSTARKEKVPIPEVYRKFNENH